MTRLVRLYPHWWRERYADEFVDLVATMRAERGRLGRLWLAVDVSRGAVDARLQRRPDVRTLMSDTAVRRGVFAGLATSAVMTVALLLSNLVFRQGPNESDSDPEYLVLLAAGYLLLLVLFLAIGGFAGRWSGSALAGAKGGAAAGLVIALVAFAVSIAIDNAFLHIVSQQHDKRMAFASSGMSSMRLFLNLQNLTGLFVVTPLATVIGAGLGALGAMVIRRRRVASPS
jgi:hypothetical protein